MKTDSELQRYVMDELAWEPSVDAAEIGVSVNSGVVTLSGTVESYPQKWAAERAAERVKGVKAVTDEIEVRLPGARERTDSDIARRSECPGVEHPGATGPDQGPRTKGLDQP